MSYDSNLTKFAIRLIREHYEPSEKDGFLNVCREIAEYFDKTGNPKLASFVRAQIGDETYWIPQ